MNVYFLPQPPHKPLTYQLFMGVIRGRFMFTLILDPISCRVLDKNPNHIHPLHNKDDMFVNTITEVIEVTDLYVHKCQRNLHQNNYQYRRASYWDSISIHSHMSIPNTGRLTSKPCNENDWDKTYILRNN